MITHGSRLYCIPLLLLLTSLQLSFPVFAQDGVKPDASMRDILEAEEKAEEILEEKEQSQARGMDVPQTPL